MTNLDNGTKYVITDVSSAESQLQIFDVVGEDDGVYTCVVQNEHGNDMDHATLTVICKLVQRGRNVGQLNDIHVLSDPYSPNWGHLPIDTIGYPQRH